MQQHTFGLAFAGVIFALITTLLAGCGGGGSGGGGIAPPTPPSPPVIEIGPGPGPAASAIPAEPAINTATARNATFATAPHVDLVHPAAIDRIDQFASDLPNTEDELRAVLDDFTDWVTQEPNDAVSQAGLAAAIVISGAYNAGIAAGYTPGQILSLLEPISEIAAAGLSQGRRGPLATLMTPAADFPRPTDPDFSSANLQIGIRKFLLPAVSHAQARLDAIADSTSGANVRIGEFPSRHGTHYAYRSDVRVIGGLFRVGHALLLQFCAYQFNPGGWDWTEPLANRDDDGDGVLSVGEYLPGDPFMWRHDSANMQNSGSALRGGLATMIAAVGEAPDDSLIAQATRPDGPQVAAAKLRNLRELIAGEVQVQIIHEGGSGGAGSFSTHMNLSRLWDAPIDDFKALFPTMRPVSGSEWEALPRTASDFPRPEFGGVFPQPAPVLQMLTTGPTYIAIKHGSLEEITVIDRRSGR